MRAEDTVMRIEEKDKICKTIGVPYADLWLSVQSLIDLTAEKQAEISSKAGYFEGERDGFWKGAEDGKKAGIEECTRTHFKPDWKIKAKDIKDATEEGYKAGIREVVGFANKFLELAEHGDYSNGNEAFGIDEGRIRAGELLDSYRNEWQARLREWGE